MFVTFKRVFSRSVAHAEAEEVGIVAAAHLQRSHRPAKDIPLPSKPEARYWSRKMAQTHFIATPICSSVD